MKKLILLSLIALACITCSSKPTPTTINGEIFVVTKGAGNYKLGLINIAAYPEEDYKQFLKSVSPNIQSALSSIALEQDQCTRNAEHLGRSAIGCELDADDRTADALSLMSPSIGYTVDTDQSNADGKFQLTVPAPGTYYLVAKGSRYVGGDTEQYYWNVEIKINENDKERNVILSNNNMLTASDLRAVAK